MRCSTSESEAANFSSYSSAASLARFCSCFSAVSSFSNLRQSPIHRQQPRRAQLSVCYRDVLRMRAWVHMRNTL